MARRAADHDTEQLSAQLSDASNVLVLSPSFSIGAADICTALLAGDDPAAAAVLGVTYTKSPGTWANDWETVAGRPPERGIVVGVGERRRRDVTFDTDRWTVETVENPSDLTHLGVELTGHLSETADTGTRLRICFDSVTALLQFVDVNRTFKFLHSVTGRVTSAGAVAHYHLDPDAHDQQTLSTLTGLFDAVVEVDGGDWTVETR